MQVQEFYTLVPHIDTVNRTQVDEILVKIRGMYDKMDDQNLSFAMYKMSESIMKLKTINQEVQNFLQECIKDIIRISIHRNFAVGTQALRNIFNTDAQFYKQNRLDVESRFPLGLRYPLKNYSPEVGQQCDIVKPYISSISYCGWTRGTIISKDGKKYLVKYANSQIPSQTKDEPFCAPLGTRTQDFDWRMNLKIGDEVEAFHKVWYRGTVAGVQIQNGVKRIRVTFKTYHQNGKKVDRHGLRYDGLSDQDDEVHDVTSYRVQKPGTIAKSFCEYSANSQQFVLDDTYDLIFRKQYHQQQFKAIMRLNFTKSLSFLEFYQTFCQCQGHQKFLHLLEHYNKDNLQPVFNIMIIVANASFLIPLMRIAQFLPQMINKVVEFLFTNTKNLNPARNDMASFFIDVAAKRVMSLSQKHMLVHEIRKKLAIDFLKLNMQKQMIALRLLYEIINPLPRKHTQQQKIKTDEFLVQQNIFYQLIQPNTHQQILLRAVQLIKYMLQNSLISFKQIQYLWNIYPASDIRGRATVQRMIGEISRVLSLNDTVKMIEKILTYKQEELTADNLSLLRSLKDHKQLTDDTRLLILQRMWQIITQKSTNITESIEEQVEKVFKSILPALNSNHTKLQLLIMILNRLQQAKYLRSEFDILKQVILTYPKRIQNKNKSNDILKIEEQTQQHQNQMKDQSQEIQIQNQNVPQTLSDVMEYLKQKNIYQTITNLFNQLKNPQKMKTVLWFTSFLFQNDKDQVSPIVKIFYHKMGPTDAFFEWAQHISQKAQIFFVELLENFEDIGKFEQLSTKGFEALKQIIFDVNVNLKNIKIVKKMKSAAVQSSSQKIKQQQKNQSSAKGPIYGPTQKPQTISFLYLLRSPYECKGVKFLQELLCVVKNNKVYDEIIKMIIQFFVNLDQSIIPRTKQFRSQFLMEIIQKFSEINMKNEFNEKIKTRLEMNVGLLQQLFAETQKDGLLDIKPHFQSVEGEMLKLSIENHITNNKVEDKKIQVSENVTLWTFKTIVGNIFNQKPEQLSIHKFMSPIADELNAKSLSDLHFYNKQSIRVQRKPAKDIPRKELVNETGQYLSPKFGTIVQKWFNSYKNSQQLLGIQELKKLSSELWRGSALKQINKLSQMIHKFDLTNKNALSLQEFKQFFVFKSAQNSPAVWKLINLSGYNNNLRHKDDNQKEIIDSNIYPRRILSTQKVYNVVFSLLENPTFEPVHLNFYRLLAQLQTDITLKQEVRKNAKSLISDQKSVYKLSYILETILAEILVNDQFFFQFYRAKGCEFIYSRLQSIMLQQKSIYQFDTLLKTIIMPNMLKITNNYVYSLHSSNKMSRFLKKSKINHIELDFLQSQVKKVDQIVEDKNDNEERLKQLKKIQLYINQKQWLNLSQKILRNLVNFFNNDLLQKLTNQLIRLYSLLCLTQNQLNFEIILTGLKSESLNYRRSCQNIAYLYILKNQSHVKQFLQLLLSNLPQQSKAIYSYYFKLLQKVLEMYIDLKKEQKDDSEFIQLANRLFKKLFDELPNQNRNAVVADKLLLGVLMVINVLITKRPNVCKHFVHLKKELLTKCLFFYHPNDRLAQLQITPQLLTTPNQPNHFPDYVKCKSQETRKILMQIIFHLHEISASEDPLFVDHYILPVFDDLPDKKRKFDTKSMQVGLSNLGSTCYMNSMLQLINSVPQFRNLLMMSQSQAPLVKELQKLFAYLYYSQRQDYMPQDLLKAFTPPIQKGIQQDTTQFLNILFDQLDKCLKGTPQHNLLQEMFQGTQATQMICHACQQKRERQQTFFTYSVQIEGKYDLHSALQGMNIGEVISDCACQYCGQRSDTTKRTIIDKIPKLFFVPLKRIVFNYDVFMNTKIHTRLQFPPELDFQPYTKQGIELRQSLGLEYMKNLKDNEQERKKFQELALHGHDKNYYKLKLKGIIVHSGGPEVGHYWAITRKQNSWLKFDDSRVAVFPHSNMEGQCYGGNFQNDQWGGMGSSTNAYVLLYERQLKHEMILGLQHQQQQQRRVIPFDKIQTFNTAQLYKQVWLDNHSLMLQNHLLKQSYCKEFLHFLLQMLRITPSQSKIKVIAQTLYKVCYHSGQVGKLSEALLDNISQLNFEIFTKYIIGDKHKTFELLFHNNLSVREFTALFIEKTLLETYKKGTKEQKQEITKFIDEYLLLIHNQVAKNWLRIDGYFKLFHGLVTGSVFQPQLYKYFIEKHLIAYFIDFIMEKSSPLSVYPKKYSVGTKSNPAHFGHAIQMIFFLIKRSYGFTGQNYEIPQPPVDQLFHLSENDTLCLSSIPFYEKMLRERQNLQILGLIIQRFSIKNIKFSQAIARIMIVQLNQVTDAKDEMVDICNCISKFLVITDEFWQQRAEFILGYSSPYIFNDNLLASVDEQRFVYASTLQDLFPVQCLLAYCHINKLRNPLTVLHIIKTILQGCNVSYQARQYLLSQRSPTYTYERYIDWIRPYINNVVETLNLAKQKKQVVLKQVQICNSHLNDFQKQKLPIDKIITGKIGNAFVVDRFSNSDDLIQVVVSNVECYTVKSQPTGQGNETLDRFLVNGRLSKKVTSDSNILLLFKQFSKPLAIKQAVQQAEDKQIQSLFDDCVDTKVTQNKDAHTVETQANSQHQSQQVVKVVQIQNKKIEEQIMKENSQQKLVGEQVQKNKMEQQQEVIEQINVPGVQLTPNYLRKIEIINNSNKTKRVTLLFKTNQHSNMLVPSKVFFVSTRVAVQTIWICKIDSNKPWGTVDYQLIVQEKDPKPIPKSFKLYGQDNQSSRQHQPMEIQPIYTQQAPYMMQNQENSNNFGQVAQISCPICTLLNLSTQTTCEACGSSLRG